MSTLIQLKFQKVKKKEIIKKCQPNIYVFQNCVPITTDGCYVVRFSDSGRKEKQIYLTPDIPSFF